MFLCAFQKKKKIKKAWKIVTILYVGHTQSRRMLYCLKHKAGKAWDAEIWFTHLITLLRILAVPNISKTNSAQISKQMSEPINSQLIVIPYGL
jgi:hypothetical protein